ncbi:MAG: hypothetical protein AB7F35_20515 [Acetobacteraceae bacterium]
MRRIALLSLAMALGGCVSDTWLNVPFTGGTNPHAPTWDSENMRRVKGDSYAAEPLVPEPGNIWPGNLPEMPSLLDLERNTPLGIPSAPAPSRGSSAPPGSNQPPLNAPRIPPPSANPPTPLAQPPARDPAGRPVQTPSGQGVTSGGTPGYQTMPVPGGGSAIIVPNGNGTSTVIYPDGRIETVPTPR